MDLNTIKKFAIAEENYDKFEKIQTFTSNTVSLRNYDSKDLLRMSLSFKKGDSFQDLYLILLSDQNNFISEIEPYFNSGVNFHFLLDSNETIVLNNVSNYTFDRIYSCLFEGIRIHMDLGILKKIVEANNVDYRITGNYKLAESYFDKRLTCLFGSFYNVISDNDFKKSELNVLIKQITEEDERTELEKKKSEEEKRFKIEEENRIEYEKKQKKEKENQKTGSLILAILMFIISYGIFTDKSVGNNILVSFGCFCFGVYCMYRWRKFNK